MSTIYTIDKESTDLETHVALCSQRYEQLDRRLTSIEAKLSNFEILLNENKRNLAGIIITSSATILTGVLGLIATILIKFSILDTINQ
jgi:hypothetical protein